MTEADFIAALRTLPLHPGARGLTDDTAVVGGLVMTTDTLVEGVHFLSTDPAADVAWKLVATNLSDLAAKGALVEGILLNLPLSDHDRDRDLLKGLREIMAAHDVRLIGGDTVSLPPGAPRVLTCTAIGRDAAAPPRSGARADDSLWVTGTIGDAGAGLAIAQGHAGSSSLLAAYRRPQPRLADGRALGPVVHAMMDVSDGLLIDAARMADASGLAVAIDLAAVPLSTDYIAFAGDVFAGDAFAGDGRLAAATAGDDYQLLFATDRVPPVPATRIGAFDPGTGLSLHAGGVAIPLPDRLGWLHDTPSRLR